MVISLLSELGNNADKEKLLLALLQPQNAEAGSCQLNYPMTIQTAADRADLLYLWFS